MSHQVGTAPVMEEEPELLAESVADPRNTPGWVSIAKGEELGITVEYGRHSGRYVWVEVAWRDDPPIEGLVAAPTAEEFEAGLEVAAYQIEPVEDPSGAVEVRLVELLTEFAEWADLECGGIDAILHPKVEWCSFERYACYVWEVWAFGNRWLNCGGPAAYEIRVESSEPDYPPNLDYIPYFSDWGLGNGLGKLPETSAGHTVARLSAFGGDYACDGEVAETVQIFKHSDDSVQRPFIAISPEPRPRYRVTGPPALLGAFATLDELLAAIELPDDTLPYWATLKISEPYFSQLRASGLPECADHQEPSIFLEDDNYGAMTQGCLHLEELA